MTLSRLSTPRLAVSIAAALLTSAAAAPAAFASNTTISVTGTTLVVEAGAGTTNAIRVADEVGAPGWYRITDIGSGAVLAAGTGLGSIVKYSATEWVVGSWDTNFIKSARVAGRDLSDALNTSTLSIPTSLLGGPGNDILIAGSGRTTLTGSGGNDSLTGGANEDVLIGGSGTDNLSGGASDDLFFAVDGGTADTINGGAGTGDEAFTDGGSISNVEFITLGD